MRETFLGRIADEMAQRDGKTQEMHFRRLIEQEDTRRQFKHIKHSEGRGIRKGVDMIEKDENGLRIRITDKQEIE
jgi:hypothetical protein